uniref:RING-type domain-containing protein n=1 Tax=Strongyloides venezuelensis TaxID=75913 RepID=A0A0K0FL60_STRVS
MSFNDSQWIRCNRCIGSLSQMQLYLTLSGHLFCLYCLELDAEQSQVNCPTCNSNTHLLEINSKLGQNKSIYFKDTEEGFNETKKKIDKIGSFQRYHFENDPKNMSLKFRRAVEAAKASEKMKDEFKRRETQLLAIIKEKEFTIKKKDVMIKENEGEIINLKNEVTQVNQLSSRHKEGGRDLQDRLNQHEIYSQQSNEKLLLAQTKLGLNKLKHRGEENNKISDQKPDHDLSKLSFSFNLQKEMNQPSGKRSKSSGYMSSEMPNIGDSEFPRFKKPTVPMFIPNKNLFTLEDSNVEKSFGFPGISDESIRGIRYNKLQQCFRPLSTSTHRHVDILPAISHDTSVISEIPFLIV